MVHPFGRPPGGNGGPVGNGGTSLIGDGGSPAGGKPAGGRPAGGRPAGAFGVRWRTGCLGVLDG